MAITLQIIGLHNCEGCTRKVRTALCKIGGVELVEFDPERGNVIVSTPKHPEVIKYALERHIKKPVLIMSQDNILPSNQNRNSIISHQVHGAHQIFDLQELGQVVMKLSQVLDSVDVTHSNKVRVNFNHRENPRVCRTTQPRHGHTGVHIKDVDDVEYVSPRMTTTTRAPPWDTYEPSAPPMLSSVEEVVYGYPMSPVQQYRISETCKHDHPDRCCDIM